MNKLLATCLEGGVSVFETRNREEDIPCVSKKVIFVLHFPKINFTFEKNN